MKTYLQDFAQPRDLVQNVAFSKDLCTNDLVHDYNIDSDIKSSDLSM